MSLESHSRLEGYQQCPGCAGMRAGAAFFPYPRQELPEARRKCLSGERLLPPAGPRPALPLPRPDPRPQSPRPYSHPAFSAASELRFTSESEGKRRNQKGKHL